MNVPYLDLKTQYNTIKPEIDAAFQEVFNKMQFICGEEVELFEKEFASFLQIKHVIAVNSGTDALILGMEALDLTADDEVIVPVNTFYATALAVVKNKAKLVFVDTDSRYGISLSNLEKKITTKTKAVIVVHLYGQPDDLGGIKQIIAKKNPAIHLIEDACQAHGAKYNNKYVGTFGRFSAFSFYPGKNLGAYGDGGAIGTNDDELAKKYRLLREYGQTAKYHHETIGTNSRLDSLQAAILRKKLTHLSDWNARRQAHAKSYNALLKGCKEVVLPEMVPGRESTFHIYAIRAQKRDALQKYLVEHGINTLIHYPIPLHCTGAFSYLGHKNGDFPVAEEQAEELLSLPMYPELLKEQIEYVANTIREFYLQS